MMSRKWITFDLDGTLMQNPFADWVFPEINEFVRENLDYPGSVSEALFQMHLQYMKEGRYVDAYDWDGMLQQILADKEMALEIDIEKIVRKHCTVPKVHLLEEGTRETLETIKAKGYHLAVVTNGFLKYQFPVLEAIGIADVFDEVLTPDGEGFAKPEARFMQRLKGKEEIATHVGDRLDHDIVFANALGIESVLIWRSMPSSLHHIQPAERSKLGEVIEYCNSKFQQETGVAEGELQETAIPNLVIHSLKELLDQL